MILFVLGFLLCFLGTQASPRDDFEDVAVWARRHRAGVKLPSGGSVAGLRRTEDAVLQGWAALLYTGANKGYPTYAQANDLLSSWVSQYPEILTTHTLGESLEHRPILAYVLGAVETPAILVTSLVHAREPPSLAVTLYFLGHLLELCAEGDAEAMYLVRFRSIWVVPFANPDGYVAVEELKLPNLRKNRRQNCKNLKQAGVDINRNFHSHWERERSACVETYGGEQPFSEPESRAIRDLFDRQQFAFVVNVHTFGNMLSWPYGFSKTATLPRNDQAVYDELAARFSSEVRWITNASHFQKIRSGNLYELLHYTAHGDVDDWVYDTTDALPMTLEVGSEEGGFYSPLSEVPDIVMRNHMRLSHISQKAGIQLDVRWSAGFEGTDAESDGFTLHLVNRGVGASSSDFLRVAMSGVVGLKSQVRLRLGDSDPLLVAPCESGDVSAILFQIPAVLPRSTVNVQVLADGVEAGYDSLSVCALEGHQEELITDGVCHCLSPVPFETKRSPDETFVRTGDVSHSLCKLLTAPPGSFPRPPASSGFQASATVWGVVALVLSTCVVFHLCRYCKVWKSIALGLAVPTSAAHEELENVVGVRYCREGVVDDDI